MSTNKSSNITQPVDYEIREVTRKSLMNQAKRLADKRTNKDVVDFCKDVFAYLKDG